MIPNDAVDRFRTSRARYVIGLTIGNLRNTGNRTAGRQMVSLCDQRDVQVFTTLDCNIPTARGLHVVTDQRTPVLVANRLKM